MGSCSESHPRIQGNDLFVPLGVIGFPGRFDHNLLPHFGGVEILFPGVGPVLFADLSEQGGAEAEFPDPAFDGLEALFNDVQFLLELVVFRVVGRNGDHFRIFLMGDVAQFPGGTFPQLVQQQRVFDFHSIPGPHLPEQICHSLYGLMGNFYANLQPRFHM